jgi:hypothetical protein
LSRIIERSNADAPRWWGLGLPAGQTGSCRLHRLGREILKGHENQPCKYRGLDAYGARCAVLHAFGAELDFHKQNPDVKKFGYRDGGKHAYDPAIDQHLVIIGTASFLNDVVTAVGDFVQDWKNDLDLRARVASRLPRVPETLPAPVNG